MVRRRVLVVAALLVAGAAFPLLAQQPQANPSRTKEPRAPGAGKTLGARPAPAAQPSAPTAPSAGQPGAVVTPQAAVTTPAAPPAAPAAPAASAFTAGLALAPFSGSGDGARYEYLRSLSRNLDSATVALTDLFRNTSGQPMAGATGPTTLSGRERDRWARCRNLYWDYSSLAAGLHSVGGPVANASVARAVASLDSAVAEVEALSECDNVASMISAPERWVPWQEEYASAARRFYGEWYGQVREAHEKVRALVVALNAVLPADRALPVPPGLPRNPPYAGAR